MKDLKIMQRKKTIIAAIVIFAASIAVYQLEVSPSAKLKKAHIYYNGINVEPDIPKAIRLYTSAAQRGNADAQFTLGAINYREGRRQEGARWYKIAAQNGHSHANSIVKELERSGFSFSSDEAIFCKKDVISCIKKNDKNALKKYVHGDLHNSFFEKQVKFVSTLPKKHFPIIELVYIGQTYQEFAESMMKSGYFCESFTYIAQDSSDLSSHERSIFLGNFYAGINGSPSSLKSDSCKNDSDGIINVFFTKMGTIYFTIQSKKDEYALMLEKLGYSQEEIDEAEKRKKFGMAPPFVTDASKQLFIDKNDYEWRDDGKMILLKSRKHELEANLYFEQSYIADTYDDLGSEE